MTRFRPILPIPTVKPEIAAFAGFTPKIIPNMKIMIGKNTVDPNPINHCNTLNISSSLFLYRLFNSETVRSNSVMYLPAHVAVPLLT